MNRYIGEWTIDDCSRKLKALREKFVSELKKVKQRVVCDAGPASVQLNNVCARFSATQEVISFNKATKCNS